jgi:hypothetical protein
MSVKALILKVPFSCFSLQELKSVQVEKDKKNGVEGAEDMASEVVLFLQENSRDFNKPKRFVR